MIENFLETKLLLFNKLETVLEIWHFEGKYTKYFLLFTTSATGGGGWVEYRGVQNELCGQ